MAAPLPANVTAEQTTSMISLAHRLINTFMSPTFLKRLDTPWKGAIESTNIATIQQKLAKEIRSRIKHYQRYPAQDEVKAYLEHLQIQYNIRLKSADKKGQLTSISIREHANIIDFVRSFSAQYRSPTEHQNGQFECHQMLQMVAEYFTTKGAIEDGTGIKGLDATIKKLIDTKPTDFFARGFLSDLFVADILACFKYKSEVKYIRCKNDILSTTRIHDQAYKELNPERYHLFKIAA